jgi:hypothetical protein
MESKNKIGQFTPKEKLSSGFDDHPFDELLSDRSSQQKTLPPPPFALEAGAEKETSGTISDLHTTSEESAPKAGDLAKNEPSAKEIPDAEGQGNVSTDINLTFSQPNEHMGGGGKLDPVSSEVANGSFSQPGGQTVSPFGSESYEPSFSGISYSFKGGKCVIKASLNLKCPWGTNGGGAIDIATAKSSLITKANYKAIKADLAPSSTSPFKSPRTTYYSKALVERHEKFHGTDDKGWTQGSGIALVKKFIEGKTVTSSKSSTTDVNKVMDDARKKLIGENFKWYKGAGTSHDAYAGEIRAYADGKPHYQKLANDIEAHGKTLK